MCLEQKDNIIALYIYKCEIQKDIYPYKLVQEEDVCEKHIHRKDGKGVIMNDKMGEYIRIIS